MRRSNAVRSGDGRWDAASTDGVRMVAFLLGRCARQYLSWGGANARGTRLRSAPGYVVKRRWRKLVDGLTLADCYALVTIGISQTYGVTVEAPCNVAATSSRSSQPRTTGVLAICGVNSGSHVMRTSGAGTNFLR